MLGGVKWREETSGIRNTAPTTRAKYLPPRSCTVPYFEHAHTIIISKPIQVQYGNRISPIVDSGWVPSSPSQILPTYQSDTTSRQHDQISPHTVTITTTCRPHALPSPHSTLQQTSPTSTVSTRRNKMCFVRSPHGCSPWYLAEVGCAQSS